MPDKLALSGQKVTKALITEIIEPNPEASAFELLDAVIAGDLDLARRRLSAVRQGEDAYKFVGLLVSQLYTLTLVRSAGDRSPNTIAKESGVHPYVVQKMQSAARHMSMARISELVDQVARLDRQMKSTGVEPWTLIETTLGMIARR